MVKNFLENFYPYTAKRKNNKEGFMGPIRLIGWILVVISVVDSMSVEVGIIGLVILMLARD